MKHIKRVTRMSVVPQGEPLFSESVTHVIIEDEAAGEFVQVLQIRGGTDKHESICVNPDEWPVLREVINEMVAACEDVKPKVKP